MLVRFKRISIAIYNKAIILYLNRILVVIRCIIGVSIFLDREIWVKVELRARSFNHGW